MAPAESLFGNAEIAAFLDVKPRTVTQWGFRKRLPEPDQMINGVKVWKRSTILRWAGDVGKLTDPKLRAEYRARWSREPSPVRYGGRVPDPPQRERTKPVAKKAPAKKTPAKKTAPKAREAAKRNVTPRPKAKAAAK